MEPSETSHLLNGSNRDKADRPFCSPPSSRPNSKILLDVDGDDDVCIPASCWCENSEGEVNEVESEQSDGERSEVSPKPMADTAAVIPILLIG